MLLVPSGMAVAKALKFTGVQGTSGQKVDVTGGSQLLATEASPGNYYENGYGYFCSSCGGIFLAAPSGGNALIVKSVDLNTSDVSSPGYFSQIYLYVGDATCNVDDYADLNTVNPAGPGNTHLSYEPGLSIPAGEALCASSAVASGTIDGTTMVVGYQVPSADVPAAAPSAGQPVATALARRRAER